MRKQIDLIAKDNSEEIIFNVGNNNYYSIVELIGLLENLFDLSIKFNTSSLPKDSPSNRCPDISKVRNLGFNSKSIFIDDLSLLYILMAG